MIEEDPFHQGDMRMMMIHEKDNDDVHETCEREK